eukprot:64531-Amphidinium_carterae.2
MHLLASCVGTHVCAFVQDNEQLADAFAEANLRAKFFFWATRPLAAQCALAVGCGLPCSLIFSVMRLILSRRVSQTVTEQSRCARPDMRNSSGLLCRL